MAINYDAYLTAEQKKTIIENGLQQFAAEAYQYELNRQIATNVEDEQSVLQAETALTTLENVINVYQVELDGLS